MLKRIGLIGLLFLGGFLFYQFTAAEPSFWDGRSRVNFVIAEESVTAVSLEPEKSLSILVLPENLYLDVPDGRGQYPLSSVYELGKLEDQGGKLLRETAQNYLAVPIDGYIKINQPLSQDSDLKKIVLGAFFLSFQGRGETDFNLWDLSRLWWKTRQMRADKVMPVFLDKTAVLSEAQLADGTAVWKTEFSQLDELVKKHFSDTQIREEGIQIEVLNATNHPGLANQVARLITNMGGGVVVINNAQVKVAYSQIKIRDKSWQKSLTVKKLTKALGVPLEIGEMGESRADLQILLGEDYWEEVR